MGREGKWWEEGQACVFFSKSTKRPQETWTKCSRLHHHLLCSAPLTSPARGLISNLTPLGGLLCPHGHARAPIHRWLPPHPPALVTPAFASWTHQTPVPGGTETLSMTETQTRSPSPPTGSVPGASRRTWSFFSGYFIIRPPPQAGRKGQLSPPYWFE